MLNTIQAIILTVLLIIPAQVLATARVTVSIAAEKEVASTVNGQKVIKKAPATTIESQNIVHYTLSYVNSGDEPATNTTLDDPIPQGTTYVSGSAYGESTEILFSIDGGKSFRKPSLLSYEITLSNGKAEKHVATPEEYTHIRWVIKSIPAGSKGKVGFQVRVN